MVDSRFYESLGPKPIKDLVRGLSVTYDSQNLAETKVISVDDLATSTQGSISFLSSARQKDALSTAKATACLMPNDLASLATEHGTAPLISGTPRAHLARIIPMLIRKYTQDMPGAPIIAKSAVVHSTAVIGAGAKIGEGVRIGPFCMIGPGVEIGEGTQIDSHAAIECAVIGSFCLIKSGGRIGTEGFGIDADENGIVNLPHIGRVIMGDYVRIGANSCIDRGFLGDTVIDDHVKIDNQVQIAHNCFIGEGTMIAAHTGISGSCHIGKFVKMGGAVGLADHIKVGEGAQLAAAAGVMHDVPAGEIWSGIPAMPIRDHMRMISATRKLITKKPGKSSDGSS